MGFTKEYSKEGEGDEQVKVAKTDSSLWWDMGSISSTPVDR